MLVPDDRFFQIAGLRANKAVPLESISVRTETGLRFRACKRSMFSDPSWHPPGSTSGLKRNARGRNSEARIDMMTEWSPRQDRVGCMDDLPRALLMAVT